MAKLELIGHDCPIGKYPSIVVPVVRLEDGRRIAVYSPDRQDEVGEGQQFVEHSPEQTAALGDFDPSRHSLFAYHERRVEKFERTQTSEFLKEFLHLREYEGSDPFVRLELAKLTDDPSLALRELDRCDAVLEETKQFRQSWRARESREIFITLSQREAVRLSELAFQFEMAPRPVVLIVEDRVDQLLPAKDYLESRGYKVLTAGDGETALSLAILKRPAGILLDIWLPKMSGPKVNQHLREIPATRDIPVLFWTNYDDYQHLAEEIGPNYQLVRRSADLAAAGKLGATRTPYVLYKGGDFGDLNMMEAAERLLDLGITLA